MTGLNQLDIHDHYRSGTDDLVSEFYMPCLGVAVRYDRAVGYFNSGSLKLALRGISKLLHNGGVLRLVISPALTAEDLKAIEDGYAARNAIEDAIERTARELLSELPAAQLELLRWLIANSRLDIRVATVAGPRPAIYHEKFGIFTDRDGNAVVFVGSSNETVSGLLANFESIEVFCSWNAGELTRVERRQRNFEDLWEGREKTLEALEFPEAARRVIIDSGEARPVFEAFDKSEGQDTAAVSIERAEPALRDYQRDAIRAWLRENGRGILAMATGTGKTITALSIVSLVARDHQRRSEPFATIIVVPYKHLVTQWNDTALQFGLRPILCFESQEVWKERAEAEVRAARHGAIPNTIIITTYATFASSAFQSIVEVATSFSALLVADEVHNIGSAATRKLLNEQIRFRLGLSATPERYYDSEGTTALLDFFGCVVYELGLGEAIKRRILVPYRYFVHKVSLTENESKNYAELSDRISQLSASRNAEDPEAADSDEVKRLLIKRARIIAAAQNKLPLLMAKVKDDHPASHTLVYCGDGKINPSDDEKLVARVVSALRDEHKAADAYTANTSLDARDWLRLAFAKGDLEYLVAIRCLDEGVDIPETRRAYFMASSTNPRQFIQRRGRVLRRSDETGKRFAEIHDFLALIHPRFGASGSYAQSVILRELARVRAFAELAENGPQVTNELLDLPVTPNFVL